MKNWFTPLILSLLLATPVLAQDDAELMPEEEFEDPALLPVPAEPSAAERQEAAAAQARGEGTQRAAGARLRGLDKVTGKTVDIDLANGQSYSYGRLDLLLGECRYPQNDPSSDSYAELTITDRNRNRIVFAGWMVASSPAISALDDARYDVWVISCDNA
ncbi:DUF2155 domain-containing protein [Paracoccus sp. DMF-8]|uniref:DUF2155 domain-containing protein n=1 Tax=Paracoccus sp. DMF-8 TaxID=3019445 RepID=UPI0023E86B92|nr:DUF2155 domain-containing protein [Paracoccus sp. DMF-8]MDF3605512.1 DUF2155 domain-containing protein [Paracoccus sp. DMF-8]